MRRALAALSLAFLAAHAAAQVAVPPLRARVTDLAATLSPQQREALERTLAAFEARKGSQVAVLIVPSTQPETIEQYAVRVEEAWKLGRKGVDDGVLLVVAKDDRRLRIEVGYGLEGAIPDAAAKRIVEEHIVPHLRRGDFHAGISAGVDRILSAIEGEPLPQPVAPSGGLPPFGEALIFGLVALVIIQNVLRALFGRFLGALALGGIAGTAAWLILGSLMVALAAAAIAFVIGLLDAVPMVGGGRWSSGGWHGGGGGRSGGGGASGSW